MKTYLLILTALVLSGNILAQKHSKQITTKIPPADYFIQSKNYYLLTLLQEDKAATQLLRSDAQLSEVTKSKIQQIILSLKICTDAICYPEAIKFSDSEIQQVSARLKVLYQTNNALGKLIHDKLIPSGCYNLYKNLGGSDLLVKAWEQDAAAVNYTIAVYGEGKKPNYPTIDSISYNVKSKGYLNLIYDASATLLDEVKSNDLFFEPALKAALLYLQINERKDPANYEPMALGVNKAAVDFVKSVKWSKYPYSHIIVPGAGPDNLITPLSGEGMLRCRLAAKQYFLGLAPFIMVSGGKAHPFKTKNCEAEEMKKYLVNILKVPAQAVIMEPHARHTTTNLRNGARLVYKYGIPASKPGLIITDKSQTDYIMTMDTRCIKELGYVPYRLGNRMSDTEVEYYALPEARQIDPDEPLDPK